MMNRLLSILAFSVLSFTLIGQNLISPQVHSLHPTSSTDIRICGAATSWSAGTSQQALGAGAQSTNVEFLCFGDALDITHDGNFVLTPADDPIPGTPPGISYVAFLCPPTATGPDIVDVENDPCVLPSPAPTSYNFLLDGVVDAGGNGTFVNNGAIQGGLNGGDPMELYFAPITVHNHGGATFEGSGTDFCINMNPADGFRVVYLNDVVASAQNTNAGGNCNGSFVIEGGLPEFDALNGGSSNYTITIAENGNAANTATITSGPATEGSTVNFTVASAGVYDVTVDDGVSCGTTFQMDMSACAPSMSASVTTSSDVSCNGLSDGEIEVDIQGGNPGYTIDWQLTPAGAVNTGNAAATGIFTISGLSAGTYSVTVTDNVGATATGTATVDQPGALGASLVNLVPPTCNGDSDGSVSVQVTEDGVLITPDPSYTFTWNIPQSTQTITGLASGPYAVTVSDGNGCTATASATLSQPPAITADPLTGMDAACIGVSNGSVSISNLSGGTGTLDISWNTLPTPTTTPTATGLDPGNYVVVVTDDSGCTYTDNITIGAATVLTASAAETDITCNGANDGSITATPTATGVDNGGYNFAWSGGAGAAATVTGLGPDTYTVTVTDALGCLATATATVDEPSPVTATATAVDESCTVGNDGQVSVVAGGGTPGTGYTYAWSNMGNTSTITGLSAGTYTVTVSDANACTVTASGTVGAPTGPVVASFDSISVQCPNDTNGSLTVNATAGSTPINGYTWSNMQTGPTISNIGPGTYTVTISDDGGCITTASASLYAPSPITEVSAPVVTPPSCPGGGDATITLDLTGGTQPYNYEWELVGSGIVASGATANPVTNIGAGTYNVTVTDNNFCPQTFTGIVVNDPPPITVVFQNVQPVSCNGGIPCDGQATAVASGGLSTTYTFTWESGETGTGGSDTASALCQGDQSVTVTDGFCTVVVQMGADAVPAPPQVSIADIQTTDATCFGDTDGSATVTPTGGDGGPYTIDWSNGQSGPTATNLVPNATYTVTITDGLGCESIPFNITVGQPDLLQLLITDTLDVSCGGLSDGVIQVAPIGGNAGAFAYSWSPNITDNTNVAAGLGPGVYSVTVTDVNGCTAETAAEISEPDPIVVEYSQPEEPLCFGYSTVFSIDTVYGGSGGPYIYTIDGFNFQGITQASQVFAGEYNLQVVDAGLCEVNETITINQPAEIIVDLGPDVEIQLGESYEIVPNVTPLGALDSLNWTPVTSLSCTDCFNPTATPIDDITYTFTVTDSNGCFGSDDIFIEVDPNRNVYIPNIFSPNGDGHNDTFSPFVGVGVTQINNMMIFDRWGELVYQADNFYPDPLNTIAWDGRFDGKMMNPGVFVFIIEVAFADNQTRTYKGSVTLVR